VVDEDQILDAVDIARALRRLHPEDALIIRLWFQLEQPEDWTWPWPPRCEDIGVYVGLRFRGRAMSEAAVRYHRDAVLAMWHGERGPLRRD
jgi:hypothetical protein